MTVRVNSQDLTMELDMGAAVSVISEKTFNRLLPTAKLHPTSLLLRTYTGQPLTVVGQLKDIDIAHGACTHTFSLIVMAGDGPSRFGWDWLKEIKLDQKTIGLTTLDIQPVQLPELLRK